jgi:hypothetical protein
VYVFSIRLLLDATASYALPAAGAIEAPTSAAIDLGAVTGSVSIAALGNSGTTLFTIVSIGDGVGVPTTSFKDGALAVAVVGGET